MIAYSVHFLRGRDIGNLFAKILISRFSIKDD